MGHSTDDAYCPPDAETRGCWLPKCPVDCLGSKWGSYHSYYRGGGYVRRTRTITTFPRWGGKLCPRLFEKIHWRDHTMCKSHFGNESWDETWAVNAWSNCSRSCGQGHAFRNRNHAWCDSNAVVIYEMSFRESKLCKIKDCSTGTGRLSLLP